MGILGRQLQLQRCKSKATATWQFCSGIAFVRISYKSNLGFRVNASIYNIIFAGNMFLSLKNIL